MSPRADLGPPDLKVVGLQLWVHNRQLPDSADFWDANWLLVTAHCGASGASVWVAGPILMATDIAAFRDQCSAMHRGDCDSALLDPLEPYLRLSLQVADRLGHITATVEITPEHLTQSHRLEFELDQSYLPEIIRQCAAIVEEYPVRGTP